MSNSLTYVNLHGELFARPQVEAVDADPLQVDAAGRAQLIE
jgi:hypothetical protein